MKKIFTLAMLACLSMGAWAQVATVDLVVSTNATTPETTYYVIGTSNKYFWNATTSPTLTAANRAKFAFFATSTENVYKIKNVTNNNWLSYTSAASYSQANGFFTFEDDEANAGLFYMEKTTNKDKSTPCYQISPLKTDDTKASIYMNWLYGPTDSRNGGVDGTMTMGLYGTAASGDAGSGWSLISAAAATPEQIADAKSIIGTGVGFPKTTNAAYIALNGVDPTTCAYDLEIVKNNYINCTDINLPEEGKAYQFSMTKKDGSATWALVSNGNTLTPIVDGTPTTFYCHKINNGTDRYVFITADGKLLTYHGLTDNYDKLYTGSNYLINDFVINPLVGQSGSLVTSTTEQRFGYVALTSDNRPSGQVSSNGCFIIKEETGAFDNSDAPYHNGSYTSAVKITEVSGSINASNPASIAKAKIDALVEGYLYRNYYGEGLGQYSISDPANSTYTWAQYNSRIGNAEDQSDIAGLKIRINQPEKGKFYTFKNAGKYHEKSADNYWNGTWVSTTIDKNSIFYLDSESHLIQYGTGYFANGVNVANDVVNTPQTYTFHEARTTWGTKNDGVNIAAYGDYCIHGSGMTGSLMTWENSAKGTMDGIADPWAAWVVEEAESLPIKVNAVEGAYYGTINLPVAVTIPADLKAYSAVAQDDVLTLTKVVENGVLAANTPVILYSGADVTSLEIADETGTAATENELLGTVAAAAVTANDNYVLSNQTSGIGFYKYNNTTMPGFKAYLPATAKTNANKLAFNFEDVLTAIQAIESNNCSAEIFDLQGRRLNQAQKGMNIINGHKVLVK